MLSKTNIHLILGFLVEHAGWVAEPEGMTDLKDARRAARELRAETLGRFAAVVKINPRKSQTHAKA
jgi:hypothetical protein